MLRKIKRVEDRGLYKVDKFYKGFVKLIKVLKKFDILLRIIKNMNNKTVQELKQICRENDFKGYSKYTKKQELLKFFLMKIFKRKIHKADAELAKLLYESEQEYFKKKQQEEIIAQKNGRFLRKRKEEEQKKIKEQNEMKNNQDLEYEKGFTRGS